MKIRKNGIAAVLAVFVMILALAPVTAMAANKALRATMVFEKTKKDNDDRLHAFFGAQQKAKNTATTKMKISAVLYVPTGCFKKTGDFIMIDPMVNMFRGKEYGGSVFAKIQIQAELQKGNKLKLFKTTDRDGGKLVPAGSLATYKKKNGFYIITLKGVPLSDWAFSGTPDTKIKINTKKTWNIETLVRVYRNGKTKWNGTFYLDNITLKAKKTQKITFDKKDYLGLTGYSFSEDVYPEVKVVKMK